MLVIPCVSDQPVNGAQVQKLGLGKVLPYKMVTPARLREAALSLLEDEKILENLQNMKETVSHALGNAGAVRILEEYTLHN